MSQTFAFIGSRPDLAGAVVRAHESLLTWERVEGRDLAWGAGYFQNDEVLLQRRPNVREVSFNLADELAELRAHALVAHVCSTAPGALRTETTPPVRYGHLLFVCHGAAGDQLQLAPAIKDLLPDYLRAGVKGETFTDLLFSLFLAALPGDTLAKTRDRAPARSAAPLGTATLHGALRRTLEQLAKLTDAQGAQRFDGDLWLSTGDVLVIAHGQGVLGLRILSGRDDFLALQTGSIPPASLAQARFTAAVTTSGRLPPGWERLPDHHLLTASRSGGAELQAL